LVRLLRVAAFLRPETPSTFSSVLGVPVFGVAVDKALAPRGDASLTFRHDHFHRITDDDILAFAIARSKRPEYASLRQANASEKLIEG
jgi:hypothetical protein